MNFAVTQEIEGKIQALVDVSRATAERNAAENELESSKVKLSIEIEQRKELEGLYILDLITVVSVPLPPPPHTHTTPLLGNVL